MVNWATGQFPDPQTFVPNTSEVCLIFVMESVIPTVSDRDTRMEAKRGIKGGLEASPFADGIKFSARPRVPVGI